MPKLAQAQEPSMEEILASIRRIISDEDTTPSGSQPTPGRADALSTDDIAGLFADAEADGGDADEDLADVLDLSEDQVKAVGAPDDAVSRGNAQENDAQLDSEHPDDEPPADVSFVDDAPAPEAAIDRLAFTARPQAAGAGQAEQRLDASEAEAASRLLSPNADAAVASAFNSLASTILSSQSRTIEDLIQDMLRPMLKGWLDDNLPPLVERLVREEIERVSRGRR